MPLGMNQESWIFAVYSNYSSKDACEADFDLLVGTNCDEVDGYMSVEIVEGNYKIYEAEGAGPEPVKALWDTIHSDESVTRVFDTDFEIYSGPQDNPTIQIHIWVEEDV